MFVCHFSFLICLRLHMSAMSGRSIDAWTLAYVQLNIWRCRRTAASQVSRSAAGHGLYLWARHIASRLLRRKVEIHDASWLMLIVCMVPFHCTHPTALWQLPLTCGMLIDPRVDWCLPFL